MSSPLTVLSTMFSGAAGLFLLIFAGLLIGRIRVCKLSLGDSGVLGAALLFGSLLGALRGEVLTAALTDQWMQTVCPFVSSLGTSLFIAVIGVDSGKAFCGDSPKRKWKAFFAGVCVVAIGAAAAGLLLFDHRLPETLLLGLFAGGMTSTPALSSACELAPSDPLPAAGYGMAYCLGLLTIVLFVQLACRQAYRPIRSFAPPVPAQEPGRRPVKPVLALSGVIVAGSFIGALLPLGATGGILLCGILTGVLLTRRKRRIPSMDALRRLGLVLFFVGAGVPAGRNLTQGLSLHWFLYGAVITACAVLLGYLAVRYLFRFSVLDSLAVLSGGMTSTPAIGMLRECDGDTDLSLYAMSYAGALIALLTAVRLLSLIR